MGMLFCLPNRTGFERERRAERGGSGSGSVPVPVSRNNVNKEDSWNVGKLGNESSNQSAWAACVYTYT